MISYHPTSTDPPPYSKIYYTLSVLLLVCLNVGASSGEAEIGREQQQFCLRSRRSAGRCAVHGASPLFCQCFLSLFVQRCCKYFLGCVLAGPASSAFHCRGEEHCYENSFSNKSFPLITSECQRNLQPLHTYGRFQVAGTRPSERLISSGNCMHI